MYRGLVLSALVAAPFVPLAASTACQDCASGRFCSYETSSAAGYGVCYGDQTANCPAEYGALQATYGSVQLTMKQINTDGTAAQCGESGNSKANALPAASVLSFDASSADTFNAETSCYNCVGDGSANKWCQYKTNDGSSTVLPGGYCTASASTCIALEALTTAATAEDVKDQNDCSDVPTTTNKCTDCLGGTSKAFCAYSTTGTAATPLYFSCMNNSVTECPDIAGLDAMYDALKKNTTIKATRITDSKECSDYDSLTQDLNLGDTPANTGEANCDDCVKKNANWCNYVSKKEDNSDGPSGGYCGATVSCPELAKFENLTIKNNPKGPKTTCGGGSAAFSLSSPSSLVIAATTCVAATWA